MPLILVPPYRKREIVQAILDGLDPYFDNVSLLMHMDGSGSAFTDVKGNTVTAVGSVTQSTSQKKFGGSSLYSPTGTSHALVAASSSFLFPGDVTIETSFYIESNSTWLEILGNYQANNNENWSLEIGSDGTVRWYAAGGSATNLIISPAGTVQLNQWYHVAAVRSGATCSLYLNGILIGSKTFAEPLGSATLPLYIGGRSSYPGTGSVFVDEVRITKGIARYIANFNPPGSSFSDSIADGYLGHVALQMFMEGAENSTAFVDEKGRAVTVYGTARHSSTQKKFGSTSLYLGGPTNPGYLTVPNSPDFDFVGADFTLDCWVYITAYQTMSGSGISILSNISSATTGWALALSANGSQLVFSTRGPSADHFFNLPQTLALNTWAHVAVCAKGTKLYGFLNGVLLGEKTGFAAAGATTMPLAIGAYTQNLTYAGYPTGYFDEIRVTKGYARWTSSFNVPTRSMAQTYVDMYPSYTVSLLHLNGADGATTTTDVKGNAVTLSNPLSATQKKFGTTSFRKTGGGSKLSMPYSEAFNFGGGDFTIEGWVYVETNNNGIFLFSKNQSGSNFHIIDITPTGKIDQWINGVNVMSTVGIQLNKWHHIAQVRSGNTFTLYLDGVNVASMTSTHVFTDMNAVGIGDYTHTNYSNGIGYIDEVRITKGVARYLTNFAPPNLPFPDA